MAKKQERVPVTGQFGRGADAFFGPATEEEEKQDTGIPVQQEAVKPGSQRDSILVEQLASEMVHQDTNRQTNKSEFMKATYYITPEQDMKLERLRLARREHGMKVDKSALIREAIDQLRD